MLSICLVFIIGSTVVLGSGAGDRERSVRYRGCTTVAANGYDCVNWMTVFKFQNRELTDSLRDVFGVGDHTYCRNLDRKMNEPWCYRRKSNGGFDKTTCLLPKDQLDFIEPVRDPKCPRESSRPMAVEIQGRVGDRKELVCAEDCPRITAWERIPPSAIQQLDKSLEITALTRADQGEYSCSCGAKEVVINLVVVSNQKTKISVPDGYPTVIPCGEGCVGEVVWVNHPSSAKLLKNGSLWIESASQDDQVEGPYSCTCDGTKERVSIEVCKWSPFGNGCRIILECGGQTYTECTDRNSTSGSSSDGNADAIISGDTKSTCTGDNCGYCQQNTLMCGMFGLFSVAVVAMVAGLFVRMRIRAAKMEMGSAESPVVGTFRRKETNHYEEAIALPNLRGGCSPRHHGDLRKPPPTRIEHGVVMAGVRAAKAALIRSKDFGSEEIAVSGASEGDGGVQVGTVMAEYLPGEVLSFDENSSIEEEWSVRPDPPSNFAAYYDSVSEWSVFEIEEV